MPQCPNCHSEVKPEERFCGNCGARLEPSIPPPAAAPPAGEPPRTATTAEAVEWVAAGVGLLVVPQSLARLYHRRDLRYRTVTDAPQSSVALSWPRDGHSDLVEEMIGIVRGRTVNSTRGRPGR